MKNKSKKSQEITLPKRQKQPAIWWWLSGIIVLTLVVYSQAFTNGFTDWDDTYYVVKRSLSLQGIAGLFTSLQTQGNYHPVTLLSLAIDYNLFGFNATGYHTVNILLHLINVCLVFVLTKKLFKSEFITIVTTLLFAIHPMHVESVAWISERKDVLYVLFYLTGLWCYVSYLDTKKQKFIVYTILSFILSLLSKSQAVTFPIALLLIDYVRSGKISFRDVLIKSPLLLISVIDGIAAIYAQHGVSAMDLYVHYTWLDRIIYTGYAFALYILKLFVPVNLGVLYPYPQKTDGSFDGLVYLSLLIPVGFAALLWFTRKNKILLSSLLFFVLNIALILQLLPVGDAIASERYTYLSYIGLFWVIAYGINYLIQQKVNLKTSVTIALCLYAAFFSYQSYLRTLVWHDRLTLWLDELDKYPNVPVAWNNLGMIKEDNNDAKNAKVCFDHAISLDSDYALSYSNRSMAYTQLGMYDSAIHDDNIALRINAHIKAAHQNRSASYAMTGKTDSSLMDCYWMLANYPNDTASHVNMGLGYLSAKKYDSAIVEFNWIIANYPPREVIYANRGLAYTLLGNYYAALGDYAKALQLNPNDLGVVSNRAHNYYLMGNNENAIDDATLAINNLYNPVNNLITRAGAYSNLGQYDKALQDYTLLQKLGVPVSADVLASLEKKTK